MLALCENAAGAGDVWQAESGKDLYSTSGVWKSFDLFALPHKCYSQAWAIKANKLQPGDFFAQRESLTLKDFSAGPVPPVQSYCGQIAGDAGNNFAFTDAPGDP